MGKFDKMSFDLQGRTVDPSFPYIIFASVNIIVGLMCLLLPETNRVPLPATVQEAKELEKLVLQKQSFLLRSKISDLFQVHDFLHLQTEMRVSLIERMPF